MLRFCAFETFLCCKLPFASVKRPTCVSLHKVCTWYSASMLKVCWEIFPTFNVTKSKATWPKFRKILLIMLLLISPPFPSNRHHRSSGGDCLEGKRENYQVCSVQYCVQQLYTMNCTRIWTELTVLWIGFCLTAPISLCLASFLCMYYFASGCILHTCVLCSIVTWWGGPGGIEAWSLGPLLPSVLWHCWLGHMTRKTRPQFTTQLC